MKYLLIDPGPLFSGWVYCEDKKVIAFGKNKNSEIKLLFTIGTVSPNIIIIEEPDSVFAKAGFSFRDTCYEIGAFREFFKKKMTFFYGRKEMLKHFGIQAKGSDVKVRKLLHEKGYRLTKDSWSAMLLIEYHLR